MAQSTCTTCGMVTSSRVEYHPYLFCELVRLGHTDPAGYLKQSLSSALLLLPALAGQNVGEHFRIVKRDGDGSVQAVVDAIVKHFAEGGAADLVQVIDRAGVSFSDA